MALFMERGVDSRAISSPNTFRCFCESFNDSMKCKSTSALRQLLDYSGDSMGLFRSSWPFLGDSTDTNDKLIT